MKLQILVINKVKKPFGVWFMPYYTKHTQRVTEMVHWLWAVWIIWVVCLLNHSLHAAAPTSTLFPKFSYLWWKMLLCLSSSRWMKTHVRVKGFCLHTVMLKQRFIPAAEVNFQHFTTSGLIDLVLLLFFLCPMLHLQGDLVSNPSVWWLNT